MLSLSDFWDVRCGVMWVGSAILKDCIGFIFRVQPFIYSFWTAWPWRWRYSSPSKHWKPLAQWHSITSQKTWILLNAIVRISGFTLQNLVFRINKSKGNGKSRLPTKYQDELEQDEGLALLIPDIQETANLVQVSWSRGIWNILDSLYVESVSELHGIGFQSLQRKTLGMVAIQFSMMKHRAVDLGVIGL
jgi:hypothetical protein